MIALASSALTARDSASLGQMPPGSHRVRCPLPARSGHPPCTKKARKSPSDPNSYFRLGTDVCLGCFLTRGLCDPSASITRADAAAAAASRRWACCCCSRGGGRPGGGPRGSIDCAICQAGHGLSQRQTRVQPGGAPTLGEALALEDAADWGFLICHIFRAFRWRR